MTTNRFVVSPKPSGKNKPDSQITIIILGGTPLYRMRTYGPTPLIKFDNQTLFDAITERVCLAFPNNEIILTVGFQANKVIRYVPNNIRIVENQLYEETNLTEELRLAINNSTGNKVLVINGNCVLDTDSFKKINLNESCIFVENNSVISDNGVGVTKNGEYASNFAYGIENKWCEIAYLTNRELEIMKNVINNPDRKRFFLFESLNILLERLGKLKVIEPKNIQFTKVDSPHENINLD